MMETLLICPGTTERMMGQHVYHQWDRCAHRVDGLYQSIVVVVNLPWFSLPFFTTSASRFVHGLCISPRGMLLSIHHTLRSVGLSAPALLILAWDTETVANCVMTIFTSHYQLLYTLMFLPLSLFTPFQLLYASFYLGSPPNISFYCWPYCGSAAVRCGVSLVPM